MATSIVTAAPRPYRQARAPAWVNVTLDLSLAGQAPVEAGTSDYLLVEHQVRLGEVVEHYERYVQRLVSQADLDDAAQISIEIDPEHEFVLLHGVQVTRDAQVIDKLAGARRSLLNREKQLDDGLINGRVTLHLLLQDLRVGDVLDYSYTVERRDPPAERGFNEWFNTRWTVPVRSYQLRVLRPEGRSLHIVDHGGLAAPSERRVGGWIETRWVGSGITALHKEDKHPAWYFQFPRIELSEFADWDAVRAWSLPMYEVRSAPGPALRQLVAKLRAEPDEAARIVAALRFVQDDVRYTGLEIGAGAYRPTQPDIVLARRYGDCKDKVLLLITLLRELGVEARPALVHSSIGHGTAERVPSPGAFDHVIAKVRHAGRDYWLDATASGQGGGLDTLVQADFGLALVLASGAHGLEEIPARDSPLPVTQVLETYDFRAGTGKAAKFDVLTTYSSDEADEMRVKMRDTTATELGRDYIEYYRKSYSGIRQAAPLTWTDDRGQNRFVIRETYEIDAPFEKNDAGKRKFYLEAYLITERTGKPEQAMRVTPLARAFPSHVRHEIVAYLPGKWNIKADSVKVHNESFEYDSQVHFHRGKLELSYELRSKRDHVPVGGLKDFLVALDKVHDDAYFTLTDDDDAQPVAAGDPTGPGVVLAFTLLAGLGVGGRTAWRLWKYDPRPRLPLSDGPAGLGGWMVFPTLQAIVGPIAVVYSIVQWFKVYGDQASYEALSSASRMFMLVSLMLQGILLMACVAQLVLLFRKRNSFPMAFVVVKAGFIVVAILSVGIMAFGKYEGIALARVIGTLIGTMIPAAIWIAYILNSQRVRATFVRNVRGQYPATVPPGEPAPA